MNTTRFFLLGILSTFLLNSCSKDDDRIEEAFPEGNYADGFFVLNEGSQSAGTVSFVSADLQDVEQEIYAAVNEGDDIGNYAQSMFFTEDLAFIISNGSNLITVVNRYSFELVGKVESSLQVPMYGVAIDGKAYVTNIADFDSNADDYVAVIDIENLEVEEAIEIGEDANFITEENGLLYIQNAAFGTGNKVSVFNPSTNTVERTIEIGDGLNSIEVENNTLYALSTGKLTRIDLSSDETVSEIIFPEEFAGAQNLEVEAGMIYYTINNKVYAVEIDATEPATNPLIEYSSESDWGVMYGFEVEDGRIYIADAGDFSSNSFIEIYTAGGELLDNVRVGVGPNGFYFN